MHKCSDIQKDIYLPRLATVKQACLLNGTKIYLRLAMNDRSLDYVPGQFVEVSLAGIGEAPFTIASSPTFKDGFELVVRNTGNVSNAIHKLQSGDKLGIRGPFGKSVYPVEESKGRDVVFICGGIGLVPQRSFINYILDNRDDYGDVTILLGTKCRARRFLVTELQSWSERTDIQFLETVDEGDDCWNGDVGVVTTLIPKIERKLKSAIILVCGPPVMYKFVLTALQEYDLPHENIYLNLERRMKCGVGKCGHCQINSCYICMDGPVFRYSDLACLPEAI